MENIVGYAFDIEGTIYKGGKLQPGVTTLFQTLVKTGKPIMFVSGMNSEEIKKVVKLINEQANINIKPIISSNAGAYIDASILGSEPKKFALVDSDVKKIEDVVNYYAPGSVIVYRTENCNYREKAIEADTISGKIKKGVTVVLKSLLETMKIIELDCTAKSKKFLNCECSCGDILSLEILALPSHTKMIAESITKVLPEVNLSVGASVQVSAKNKWLALQEVFGDNAKNVCYFGDSLNDIDCIKNCEYAILSNSTKQKMFDIIKDEQTKGKNKFATSDLSNEDLLNYVSSQKYDKQNLLDMTNSAKSLIKDADKPQKTL